MRITLYYKSEDSKLLLFPSTDLLIGKRIVWSVSIPIFLFGLIMSILDGDITFLLMCISVLSVFWIPAAIVTFKYYNNRYIIFDSDRRAIYRQGFKEHFIADFQDISHLRLEALVVTSRIRCYLKLKRAPYGKGIRLINLPREDVDQIYKIIALIEVYTNKDIHVDSLVDVDKIYKKKIYQGNEVEGRAIPEMKLSDLYMFKRRFGKYRYFYWDSYTFFLSIIAFVILFIILLLILSHDKDRYAYLSLYLVIPFLLNFIPSSISVSLDKKQASCFSLAPFNFKFYRRKCLFDEIEKLEYYPFHPHKNDLSMGVYMLAELKSGENMMLFNGIINSDGLARVLEEFAWLTQHKAPHKI